MTKIKHIVWYLALSGIMVLTGSCSVSRVLFVTDSYWHMYFGLESMIELKRSLKKSDYSLVVERVENETRRTSIKTVVDAAEAEIIILSPLLSWSVSDVAEQYPAKYFVAFGFSDERYAGDQDLPNTILLLSDRSDAYLKAGSLCGSYVTREIEADSPEPILVALFYTGSEERKAEKRSFLVGFSDTGSPDAIILKDFTQIDNNRSVALFIKELELNDKTPIFFSSLSSLNRDAISAIVSKSDAFIITENRRASGVYNDKIIASIEDDIETALILAVSQRNGNIQIPTVFVANNAADAQDFPWRAEKNEESR